MAGFEKNRKAMSKKLEKGKRFIEGKENVLTDFFDSIEKVISGNNRSASKPVKTDEDIVEIKKSQEIFSSEKIIIPALIIIGAYFGIRALTKQVIF